MRLRRRRLDDTGHSKLTIIVVAQRLTDGIAVSKIFLRHAFRQYDTFGLLERLCGVAPNQVETKHLKEACVSHQQSMLGERFCILREYAACICESNRSFNLGDLFH